MPHPGRPAGACQCNEQAPVTLDSDIGVGAHTSISIRLQAFA